MRYSIDLHMHTVMSGHAYSTMKEYIDEAKRRGLTTIAITDHGSSMSGAPYKFYFDNMTIIPEVIDGIRVLRGAEANIIDSLGSLDLPRETLRKLDFVIGSIHDVTFDVQDASHNTDAFVNAMKIGFVDAIGHPENRFVPIDAERLVNAAVKYNVALELNNSSFKIPYRRGSEHILEEIIRLGVEKGAYFFLGSDSHIALDVGEFDYLYPYLEKYSIPEDRILNSSEEVLYGFLKMRRSGND